MKNTKIKITFLLLTGTFLLPQFKPPDSNVEIRYQQDMALLIKKEAQELYIYTEKQITERIDWYNKISDQVFNRQALILPGDRDPLDVIIRRCEELITDLKKTTDLSVLENQFNDLKEKIRSSPG